MKYILTIFLAIVSMSFTAAQDTIPLQPIKTLEYAVDSNYLIISGRGGVYYAIHLDSLAVKLIEESSIDITGASDTLKDLNRTVDSIFIEGGAGVNLSDLRQSLQRIGNKLVNSGTTDTVDISDLLDNTDAQQLNLVGTLLTLTNSVSADLSGFLDNTDDQVIGRSGYTVTLEDGGGFTLPIDTVNIPSYPLGVLDTTGFYFLVFDSVAGRHEKIPATDIIQIIEDYVTAGDLDQDPTNELQNLTLVGDSLGLTNSTTKIDLSQYRDSSSTYRWFYEVDGVVTEVSSNDTILFIILEALTRDSIFDKLRVDTANGQYVMSFAGITFDSFPLSSSIDSAVFSNIINLGDTSIVINGDTITIPNDSLNIPSYIGGDADPFDVMVVWDPFESRHEIFFLGNLVNFIDTQFTIFDYWVNIYNDDGVVDPNRKVYITDSLTFFDDSDSSLVFRIENTGRITIRDNLNNLQINGPAFGTQQVEGSLDEYARSSIIISKDDVPDSINYIHGSGIINIGDGNFREFVYGDSIAISATTGSTTPFLQSTITTASPHGLKLGNSYTFRIQGIFASRNVADFIPPSFYQHSRIDTVLGGLALDTFPGPIDVVAVVSSSTVLTVINKAFIGAGVSDFLDPVDSVGTRYMVILDSLTNTVVLGNRVGPIVDQALNLPNGNIIDFSQTPTEGDHLVYRDGKYVAEADTSSGGGGIGDVVTADIDSLGFFIQDGSNVYRVAIKDFPDGDTILFIISGDYLTKDSLLQGVRVDTLPGGNKLEFTYKGVPFDTVTLQISTSGSGSGGVDTFYIENQFGTVYQILNGDTIKLVDSTGFEVNKFILTNSSGQTITDPEIGWEILPGGARNLRYNDLYGDNTIINSGVSFPNPTTNIYNVAIGTSGYSPQGDYNISISRDAGRSSDGSYNVYLGYRAGRVSDGSNNIALGENALNSSIAGNDRIALGEDAGLGLQADGTLAFLFNCGYYATDSDFSIFQSFGGLSRAKVSYSTVIGYDSGDDLLGTLNTILGSNSVDESYAENSIIIGNENATETAILNSIIIGNENYNQADSIDLGVDRWIYRDSVFSAQVNPANEQISGTSVSRVITEMGYETGDIFIAKLENHLDSAFITGTANNNVAIGATEILKFIVINSSTIQLYDQTGIYTDDITVAGSFYIHPSRTAKNVIVIGNGFGFVEDSTVIIGDPSKVLLKIQSDTFEYTGIPRFIKMTLVDGTLPVSLDPDTNHVTNGSFNAFTNYTNTTNSILRGDSVIVGSNFTGWIKWEIYSSLSGSNGDDLRLTISVNGETPYSKMERSMSNGNVGSGSAGDMAFLNEGDVVKIVQIDRDGDRSTDITYEQISFILTK